MEKEDLQAAVRDKMRRYNEWYWRNLHPQERKTLEEGMQAMMSKEDKEDAQPDTYS